MPETADHALARNVGYCGLVCGVCRNALKGCTGCRKGGGDEHCYQRECCEENGIEGCWECGEFPCGKGYFADDAWKGLCIGSVQAIKDHGLRRYIELVTTILGSDVEYGDYRFKDPDEIRAILAGEPRA